MYSQQDNSRGMYSNYGGGSSQGGGSQFQGQSQHHQQQPQQIPQQHLFAGGFQDVANTFSSAVSNPLVSSMANQKFTEMQDYMMPGASGLWNTLRYYFHVDNKFVIKKFKVLLFPWRTTEWGRIPIGDSNPPTFAPPVGDINAPDMYLPVMAFLSYVLCIGGLRGQGNPTILEKTFSTCTLTVFVEMCVLKGGLYLLTLKHSISTIDLIVYCGYKFVGLGVALLLGIAAAKLGIPYVYAAVLLYTAACQGFFLFQTLNKAVSSPPQGSDGRKRRLYFIVACTVLQILTFLFLGYLDDISPVAAPVPTKEP